MGSQRALPWLGRWVHRLAGNSITKSCLDWDRSFSMAGAHSVLNGTGLRLALSYRIQMRMSDLTAKEFFSVPCPTCGVAPGERCLLHSGAPRSGPHLDRKLSAAEAIETKRIPRRPGLR